MSITTVRPETMNKDALEYLQALGFGEYEARAYLSRLRQGPMTGYQLAKASAIPRPNIYPILDRLLQRGAVNRIEAKRAVRYAALPAEQMLDGLGREVTGRLEMARTAMRGLEEAGTAEQVWNVQGHEAVMARAGMLIDGARRRLLVGVWSEESRQLAAGIARAESRGVDVTTLCIQGCPQECGNCRGEIYRYPLAQGTDRRWLVLVADDESLLVGQVLPDGDAVAAFTRLEAFVAVGGHYLRNAIATAEIVRSFGTSLPQALDDRARRAVQGAGLVADGGETWFDKLLSSVAAGPPAGA